jgi:hypothetical protein
MTTSLLHFTTFGTRLVFPHSKVSGRATADRVSAFHRGVSFPHLSHAATQDSTAIADVALGKPVNPSLFVREVRRLLGADYPASPMDTSNPRH